MFHLNLTYVNQADREREIEDGLCRHRMLRSQAATDTPVEAALRSHAVAPRQVPIRPRPAAR